MRLFFAEVYKIYETSCFQLNPVLNATRTFRLLLFCYFQIALGKSDPLKEVELMRELALKYEDLGEKTFYMDSLKYSAQIHCDI